MSNSAVVVLSGGQDSTTCLYWAKSHFDNVSAVTFRYGQRHSQEISAAERIAATARAAHFVFDLTGILGALGDSALLSDRPITSNGGLPDAQMPQGLPNSFVPGRNLLMLSAAAALAVKLGAKHLVTGVCQTDYSGYPDCRQDFISSLEQTITLAMP